MQRTSIEWTDVSANPIRAKRKSNGKVGHHCVMVSPGCARCYSAKWNGWRGNGLPFTKAGGEQARMFLDEKVLAGLLKQRKPCRVFLCDMTDIFGDWVPDWWLDRIFAVATLTPHITYQILTKRADRMEAYMTERWQLPDSMKVESARGTTVWEDRQDRINKAIDDVTIGNKIFDRDEWWTEDGSLKNRFRDWPLSNCWLGVSVEDQKRADERIPHLLRTPAAVRFLSVEPLLGPVDLDAVPITVSPGFFGSPLQWHHRGYCHERDGIPYPTIDWAIVGGESGPKARPCQLGWIRSIVEDCKAAGVPVFVKQLGACPFVDYYEDDESWREWSRDRIRQVWAQWHGDIFIHDERHDGQPPPFSQIEVRLKDRKGGDITEFPEDLKIRLFPNSIIP